MFNTALHIDNIIAKFAHLKSALDLHGKNGTLSLHKHAELVMMNILTLVYGYQLEVLGKDSRFPAVDLGSELDGIAVQVTSRNDNEKVNDAIEKFLKNSLQQTFPRMVVMMMNTRLPKYPLMPFSDPNFQFNPATDIIDLNNLTQKIKTLMPIQIQMIAEYLTKEFPAIVAVPEHVEKYLIDVQSDSAARELRYYYRSAIKIEFGNGGLSAAKLYRWLSNYFNTAQKRFLYFNIFNEQYRRQSANSSEIIFEIPLNDKSAINYAKHSALRITQDCIQVEFAAYYNSAEYTSNLSEELGPMLPILLASASLKLAGDSKISVSYQYNTNGKFMFYNLNSPLAVDTYMQVFYINKNSTVKKVFKIVNDEEICELLQEIADTFLNEPLPFQNTQPFMSFDRAGQINTLNFIRGRIQPTLGEIS